jgi:hypothetical protein
LAAKDFYTEKGSFSLFESEKIMEDRDGKLHVREPSPGKLLSQSKGFGSIRTSRPLPEGAVASYTKYAFLTREDMIKTSLDERGVSDIDGALEKYSFYTISFNLVIAMNEPVNSFLEFAKFGFKFDKDVTILKIMPETEGIKSTLDKTITRNLKITPTFELKAAGTITANTSVEYIRNNGWTYSVPINIVNVKGYTMNYVDNVEVFWDIYGRKDTHTPDNNIGETTVVLAVLSLQAPKDRTVKCEVFVDGQILQKGKYIILDGHENIGLVSPEQFKIN